MTICCGQKLRPIICNHVLCGLIWPLHFVGTTAWTNLKTPHCFERLALFNKSFLDVRVHILWWKPVCALEFRMNWPEFPYKIHPHKFIQIPCSYRESIFSSCIHSVPFKNMYVGLTKRPWSLTEFGRLAKKEYCCYKETVHSSPFFPLHICTGNHSVEHTSHPFL